MKKILFLIFLLPAVLWAQDSTKPDVWDPIRFFVGSWESDVTGKSGIGKGEREYSFILGENYLHYKNKAVFEPNEKNPEGEVHEDWGFFSFDGGRKRFVLRQFHVEGFTNQFLVDSISDNGRLIVLTTENIENAPPGMIARYIIKILSEDKFIETFDLAFSGKELETCIVNNWHRKK